VEVPQDKLGWIIGKKGANIAELQQETGVSRADVSKNSNPPTVVLIGTRTAVDNGVLWLQCHTNYLEEMAQQEADISDLYKELDSTSLGPRSRSGPKGGGQQGKGSGTAKGGGWGGGRGGGRDGGQDGGRAQETIPQPRIQTENPPAPRASKNDTPAPKPKPQGNVSKKAPQAPKPNPKPSGNMNPAPKPKTAALKSEAKAAAPKKSDNAARTISPTIPKPLDAKPQRNRTKK